VIDRTGQKRTLWDGGYVRHGKKHPTYVIERWVDGIHFHISTRCHTSGAAHEQLKRFESDPVGYRPSGTGLKRVHITADLVLRYCTWMGEAKSNSEGWCRDCARWLADWTEDFATSDLRSVKLHELETMLDKRKHSRPGRITALKGFCKWLRRREGLITSKEDPTVDLVVPQAKEAARSRAVPEARISAVLPYLPEDARDLLLVLMGTGAHISEIKRFASVGELAKQSKTKAIMYMVHKTKRVKPFPLVGRVYVEAAERLKARGRLPSYWTLNTDMTKACADAGVERFTLGVLRHSFTTNAFKRGATMAEVGDAVHHSTPRTTRRHYVVGVPPKAVPPLRVLRGGS
jgi:integrase